MYLHISMRVELLASETQIYNFGLVFTLIRCLLLLILSFKKHHSSTTELGWSIIGLLILLLSRWELAYVLLLLMLLMLLLLLLRCQLGFVDFKLRFGQVCIMMALRLWVFVRGLIACWTTFIHVHGRLFFVGGWHYVIIVVVVRAGQHGLVDWLARVLARPLIISRSVIVRWLHFHLRLLLLWE